MTRRRQFPSEVPRGLTVVTTLLLMSMAARATQITLHDMIEHHNLEGATALLKSNPKLVSGRGTHGEEPLATAVFCNDVRIVKLLLDYGADVNTADDFNRTALHEAAGASFIHAADAEIAALLLAHKASVNARDKDGRTPLWYAVGEADLPSVKVLLAHGANVNVADNDGVTPLDRAAYDSTSVDPEHNDLATVKLLLNSGANINATDSEGKTVLHRIIDPGWPFEEYAMPVVAFLIANKVDVNALDEDGCSTLHYAKLNGNKGLATLLLRHGGKDVARPTNKLREAIVNGNAAAIAELLEQDPKLATENGPDGVTPLHWAAGNTAWHWAQPAARSTVTELLLKEGLNPNAVDAKGRTALHYAALSDAADAAEALLTHGANINAKASDGNTPLIDASIEGRASMVEFLLAHGADAAVKNKKGRTASSEAIASGDPATIRILGK